MKEIATLALVCAVPFLIFWDHNKRDLVDVGAIGAGFAIALGGAFALYGLARLCTARSSANIVNALSLALIGFFLFDAFASGLAGLAGEVRNYALYGAWSVLLLAVIAAAWQRARGEAFTLAILVGALAMIALPSARLAAHAFARPDNSHLAVKPAPSPAGTARPNIFFIILDGYARADVLKEFLGYDNAAFLSFLAARGFYVAERATSNYPTTILSVSSTLSMQYVQTEAMAPFKAYKPFLEIMRGSNAAVESLRVRGYRYVLSEPGHEAYRCRGAEDACIRSGRNAPLIGETGQGLLRLTPLHRLAERYAPGLYVQPAVKSFTQIGDVGEAILSAGLQPPTFAFVHLFAPHPPYTKKADCSENPAATYDLKSWTAALIPAYVGYLACVNREIAALTDRIIGKYPDAIIIVQADHGSSFFVDWKAPPDRWPDKAVHERFAVLNAMRLPERCRGALYPSISLVNTFRVVLACLDARPAELLPDKSYAAPDSDHPQFGHVFAIGAR